MSKEQTQLESDPYSLFIFGINSPLTKEKYVPRLNKFFDFINLEGTIQEKCVAFAKNAADDSYWTVASVIKYLQMIKERIEKKEITAATALNYLKTIKLFCEMNDIILPWKRITRGLPKARRYANDRAPTIEEIRKIIEYPDRRIKPIILVMISSGIRVGAWDYMKWKHIVPIKNNDDDVIAAKLIVYPVENETYYTFVTPEAYKSVIEWMDFRASYGEKITGESWVMRNLWRTVSMKYGAKLGLAKEPVQFKSSGIRLMIARALQIQGIRELLRSGEKRHEFKTVHGLRKFFKTQAEQVMKSINVELCMGHNIGVSKSYYKPSERELLEDYTKAVNLLTISNDKSKLEKQVKELSEKGKDSEYIIQGKLREKDNEIKEMKEQIQLLKQSQK